MFMLYVHICDTVHISNYLFPMVYMLHIFIYVIFGSFSCVGYKLPNVLTCMGH